MSAAGMVVFRVQPVPSSFIVSVKAGIVGRDTKKSLSLKSKVIGAFGLVTFLTRIVLLRFVALALLSKLKV